MNLRTSSNALDRIANVSAQQCFFNFVFDALTTDEAFSDASCGRGSLDGRGRLNASRFGVRLAWNAEWQPRPSRDWHFRACKSRSRVSRSTGKAYNIHSLPGTVVGVSRPLIHNNCQGNVTVSGRRTCPPVFFWNGALRTPVSLSSDRLRTSIPILRIREIL